jgi:hypothetical protein
VKLPLQRKIHLRCSEAAQNIAAEIALGSGRRRDERGFVEDFAARILRAEQLGRHGANQNALYLAPINGAQCRSEVAMAQPKLQLQFAHSAVLRYGFALLSFVVALGLALLAQRHGRK